MAIETVQVRGLEGVLDTLRGLPPEIVSKRGGPVRSSLVKAARVLQSEMRANVKKIVAAPNKDGRPTRSTGALEQSIEVRVMKSRPGFERARVGVFKLRRKYADIRSNRRKQRVGLSYEILPPTYYAWFLEFGTEKQTAKPFIRPAFESKKNEAVAVFSDEMNRRLEKIIRRLDRVGAR